MVTQQYRVTRAVIGWSIIDTRHQVDIIRVRAVADYMAEKLNTGHATIHPHATLGCRIEVRA